MVNIPFINALQKPNEDQAPPITRELIRSYLDAGDDDDVEGERCPITGQSRPREIKDPNITRYHHDDVVGGAPLDTLRDIWQWLDEEANEAQAKIDWTPEYSMGTRQIKGAAMDTPVLKDVHAGLGPRPSKTMDILADIRKDLCALGIDKPASGEESYKELMELLQLWNNTILDGSLERGQEELLLALEERNYLLKPNGQHVAEDLDLNSTRLIAALSLIWPEVAKFDNQTPYDVLSTVIIHRHIANLDPGTEMLVWDTMFKTLLVEMRLRIERQYAQQKAALQAQLHSAHKIHNQEEVQRIRGKKEKVKLEIFSLSSKTLIDALKERRRHLRAKYVLDMQDLATVQSAAKSYASSILPASLELAQKAADDAESKLEQALQRRFDDLEAKQIGNLGVIEALHCLAATSYIRSRKFVALDVDDVAAIERVRKERMKDPETAFMMMRVVEDNRTVAEMSRRVAAQVAGMYTLLDEVLDAARDSYCAYDDVLRRVEGDSEGQEVVVQHGSHAIEDGNRKV
jgi:hypothetical protein